MADPGPRRHGVQKKIAIAATPIALVGLLSTLPAALTGTTAGVDAHAANAGSTIMPQDASPSPDTNAPTVYFDGATVSPREASREAPPRFSVRVADGAGVAGCEVVCEHADTGERATVELSLAPGAGTAADGTWEGEMAVRAGTPAGRWRVAEIRAVDALGNHSYLEDAREELFGEGVDLSHLDFSVAGEPGQDAAAPVIGLSGASVSPRSATASAPPRFSVPVTDDVGVVSCVVWCWHEGAGEALDVELSLAQGTAADGTWEGEMAVAPGTPPGAWQVSSIVATDGAGRRGVVYAAEYPWDEGDDLSHLDFEIVPADPVQPEPLDVATLEVTLPDSDDGTYTYEPGGVRPAVEVFDGTKRLVQGTDYEVSYADNEQVGSASATITGKGDYTGSCVRSFTISHKPVLVTAVDKTKRAGEPDPDLTADVEGTYGEDTVRYSLTRRPGEAPGVYGIDVTGPAIQGNYAVTYKGGSLVISAAEAALEALPIPATTYRASRITPKVIVRAGGMTLVEGIDYTLSYDENLHAGTGGVTVTGKGAYAGQTDHATFAIRRKDATIRAVDARKDVGAKDPALTWVASGLVGTDAITSVTVTRVAGETAGTYAITASNARVSAVDGTDVTGDYDLTYAAATLTITGASTDEPTRPSWPDLIPRTTPTTTWPLWRYPSYGSHIPHLLRTYSQPTRHRYDEIPSTATNNRVETPSVAPNTLPTISRRSTAAGTNGSATTSEAGSHATPATAAGSKVVRHDGSDRYATMAAAVEAAFEKSDWVIVASGESYPDALSAVALAGAHDAPVILTARNALPSQAVAQIRRLGATHAIIVGGESAITRAVEDALKGIVGDVSRVTGADRTATSVAALRALRSAKSTSDTLIVASGGTFADALSAGPWAWRTSSPIVLTDSRGMLSDEAVSAIKADGHFRRVLLVGGKDAVSDAIRNQLKGDLTYIRKGGADRYDTSLEMAKFATSNGLDWQSPMIATGDDFADALAGAAPAGKLGSPLLLIGPHDERAVSELARHATDLRRAHVLGGISAVPTSVEDALKAALS